ncbi:MAG: hypothetical protein ACRCUT_07565, partial [Spirochaetota bacterium]
MKKIKALFLAAWNRLNKIGWFQTVRQFAEAKKIFPKILCLLIAAVLWYYNDTRRISEVHYKVSVQVDMSREFAVADMEKKQVTILVRGNVEDVRNVTQNSLSAYLRIQNPVPG